jgi:hypothetical protein
MIKSARNKLEADLVLAELEKRKEMFEKLPI